MKTITADQKIVSFRTATIAVIIFSVASAALAAGVIKAGYDQTKDDVRENTEKICALEEENQNLKIDFTDFKAELKTKYDVIISALTDLKEDIRRGR